MPPSRSICGGVALVNEAREGLSFLTSEKRVESSAREISLWRPRTAKYITIL